MRRLTWGMWRLLSDLHGIVTYADRGSNRAYAKAVLTSLPQIIKTNTLVPADTKMATRTCTFRPQPGCVILVDGRDFSAAREMYGRRVYFKRPGFEIKPNETVVDLGANIGLFTTMAAVSGARVIAVEAQAGFLPKIRANLVRNGAENQAEVVHALVGAETGVLSNVENRASASAWGDEPSRVGMAELLNRYDIAQVDLLKIDIEGSEFSLFREDGFLEKIRRIAMEVHPPHGDVQHLRTLIQSHGFKVDLLNSEGQKADVLSGSRGGYLFATRFG